MEFRTNKNPLISVAEIRLIHNPLISVAKSPNPLISVVLSVLLNGCTFAKKIAEPASPGFRGRPGDVEARQPAEVEGGIMCKLSLFAQDMF